MGVLAGYPLREVKRAIQHGQPQMTIADLLGNPLPGGPRQRAEHGGDPHRLAQVARHAGQDHRRVQPHPDAHPVRAADA